METAGIRSAGRCGLAGHGVSAGSYAASPPGLLAQTTGPRSVLIGTVEAGPGLAVLAVHVLAHAERSARKPALRTEHPALRRHRRRRHLASGKARRCRCHHPHAHDRSTHTTAPTPRRRPGPSRQPACARAPGVLVQPCGEATPLDHPDEETRAVEQHARRVHGRSTRGRGGAALARSHDGLLRLGLFGHGEGRPDRGPKTTERGARCRRERSGMLPESVWKTRFPSRRFCRGERAACCRAVGPSERRARTGESVPGA